MNIKVGKSTGIALLMAAALIAALFAMGVFSAAGVGAQMATSAVLTESDPPDDATQENDTVTISVTGLSGVGPNTDNAVVITMPEDLGTSPEATWGGAVQFASDLGSGAYTAATADVPGFYTFTIPAAIPISPGAAEITITLGAGAFVDTNTTITALTIGRGESTFQNTVTLPDGGLTITGGAVGPTIRLSTSNSLPREEPGDGETADPHTLTVTGENFPAATSAIVLTAVSDATGTPAVDLNGTAGGDDLNVETVADNGFTQEITFPGQTSNVKITITATQTDVTGGTATAIFTVAPRAEREEGAALSSSVASAAVRIDLDAKADNDIPAGEDITVTLKDWGLPSSIPEDSVLILGTTRTSAEPYSGEPAEVRIASGNKVVLSLTSRYVNGDSAGPLFAGQTYRIVFKESAGITNPGKAGTYSIKVKDLDDTDHNFTFANGNEDLDIMSKITLSKSSGPRGTEITATAVGLAAGDATFYLQRRGYEDGTLMPTQEDAVDEDGNAEYEYLNEGYRLDKAISSGGKAVVTIDTTTQNFVAGVRINDKGDALQGLNVIRAVDGAGNDVDIEARFEITPLIELDGDTFKRGGKVDITVSDWIYEDLMEIQIGAVEVIEVPSGSSTIDWEDRYPGGVSLGIDEEEFSFIVPNNARLGEQELKLIGETENLQGSVSAGADDQAKGTILVGAFDLVISPSTAVTGQVIKIEGTGFEDNACIVEISVGGDVDIPESTSGNDVGGYNDVTGFPECAGSNENVESDSNGNLADTFEVPQGLKPGVYRVTVVDVESRVGIADLTIPEPEIELDPASSQRGGTVAVIGSNFPAEDVITISYRGRTVTASNTDTVGRFRGTFAVPVDAPIGEEHEVEAISADKADGNPTGEPILKAKVLHMVPDEVLQVTPEIAAPGTRITISASNLPLFTPVGVSIGSVGVAGASIGELAESDGNGRWEGTPLVPQLTPGTHTVEMTVGRGATGISVSTFLEIADIITRASDEAFEDLIDNGTLTRVWYLEAATQTWSFFDPAPEFADFNTLTEVSTGQIVTIIMATQDEFQGRSLYVGSNNVAIE